MDHKKQQQELKKSVAAFAKPDTNAGIKQIINTFVPFIIVWYLAYLSLSISVWAAIPLAMVAGGFVIRIFIIFHDCTHQSFLKNKKANRIIGTIAGIITLFPFEKWKRDHNIHHATSGNLDKRGTGDIWVLTIEEYKEASFKERLAYRLYRNPLVMFGLGPLYLFLISNRFNRKGAKKKERMNTYVTNVAIVILYSVMIWAIGWQAFLIINLPILYVSGFLGIWLFYVQHQFEDSYYEEDSEWDFVRAAVDGSSYYKLPKVLQWISGNIGFHHVHHLSPRVPNYNLEKAHDATPPLEHATTITLKTSLESIRFRLYDTENKGFVSFREAKSRIKEAKEPLLGRKRPSLQEK
ncbi:MULTISPECIES: fatty acid desaturase [Pontibacillus]|uniref:Fatty acid desaturase n=1 Tax=Pontibacillus chungwhensis TaxID=265426 RepID=A0ABY8UWN3_9BACI|nr:MULTISPECIES: fatty acid desaturase [Pontibacillus]MCD5325665.1 fatty acid desaturase [Pontibacillus sp. HN14]WIF98091.1 fatty acid desaturase [Pontibacillus chungwhensis]